eukprot:TRINITY_DN20030_c0_g1_i1.p4 TRINITY_DN20030_c0_g1~~TRINITY_DN20030_c0_g1_i1.p4  ORF type:complete len:117 (-),score=27.36 TRINITY_DN20030_c0_g1_i1:150-500(-)
MPGADSAMSTCHADGVVHVWALESAWEEHFDEASNSRFHFSRVVGRSTWDAPETCTISSRQRQLSYQGDAGNLLSLCEVDSTGCGAGVTQVLVAGSEDGQLVLMQCVLCWQALSAL